MLVIAVIYSYRTELSTEDFKALHYICISRGSIWSSLPICLQFHLACSRNERTRIGSSWVVSRCLTPTAGSRNISCNDGSTQPNDDFRWRWVADGRAVDDADEVQCQPLSTASHHANPPVRQAPTIKRP